MSSLNVVRLDDGTEVTISEWMHQPLFSVIEFNAGDGINLQAFNYTVGQIVSASSSVAQRNATPGDTNIAKKRAMTQDQALVMFSITYELWLTADITGGSPAKALACEGAAYAPDLRRLQRDCLVEVYVGGLKKPVFNAPFSYVGQSIGSVTFTSGDGLGGVSALQMGSGGYPSARNQRQLMLPIYIGGYGQNAVPGNSMPFHLRFWTPKGTVAGLVGNYRMRWYLDGLKRRPA